MIMCVLLVLIYLLHPDSQYLKKRPEAKSGVFSNTKQTGGLCYIFAAPAGGGRQGETKKVRGQYSIVPGL
jgi:hypothetical protein